MKWRVVRGVVVRAYHSLPLPTHARATALPPTLVPPLLSRDNDGQNTRQPTPYGDKHERGEYHDRDSIAHPPVERHRLDHHRLQPRVLLHTFRFRPCSPGRFVYPFLFVSRCSGPRVFVCVCTRAFHFALGSAVVFPFAFASRCLSFVFVLLLHTRALLFALEPSHAFPLAAVILPCSDTHVHCSSILVHIPVRICSRAGHNRYVSSYLLSFLTRQPLFRCSVSFPCPLLLSQTSAAGLFLCSTPIRMTRNHGILRLR